MANAYTEVEKFTKWLPQRYLAELTNDEGNYTADENQIQDALDYGAGEYESRAQVRSDIPIPSVNDDGSVPLVIVQCVHDIALYFLYNRRGHMPQQVQVQYENQLQWLSDIVNRRANVLITKGNKKVTKTNDQPVIEGDRKNKFDNFTFG